MFVSYAAMAQHAPRVATSPAKAPPHVLLRASNDLPAGCPDYSGLLDSIGVPVSQSAQFYVYSYDPAPDGGITWNVYADDPSIVAAGNRTQGFIPTVYTPAGSNYSSPFTLFGVSVGQANLIIEEVSPGTGGSSTPMTAWGVNPGNDSNFLDANFPANSCRTDGTPNLSTDPSVLSSCGGNVDGIVSDGVSQLLLRIQSGLAGTACYQITSSSSLDQGSVSTAVTNTQPVGSYDYGLSFYQAPATYGDSTDSRQVQVQFSFAPNIGNANTTTLTAPLTVIRPPLVLIHGLWSNPTTWSGIWDRPSSYDVNSRADYHATNASSFSVNSPTVQKFVADGLQKARDLGYAATQADVVGHSMGGLLTRLYAGSSSFQRPDNFNLGDVRRLVTLDTPHFGASTANLIVSMNANSLVFRTLGYLLSGVRGVGFSNPTFNQGAVCDLAENSPALQGLSGGTSLPAQVITASGGPAGTPSGGLYWSPLETALTAEACFPVSPIIPICTPTPIFPQDIVDDFRFRQPNDAIVSLTSQQGGLGETDFPAYIHTTVTGGADVASQAFQLLDGPSSGFSQSLPGVPSNGLGNPRTVPGRGVSLDQADYKSECSGSGAPLKPQTIARLMQEGGQQNAQAPTGNHAATNQNAATGAIASDPRIQIVSPTNGQAFAPGSTVQITVQLTAPLTADNGFVAVTVPGLGPLMGNNYNGSTYQASLVIPSSFAGPITVTPAILDTNKNPLQGVSIKISVAPSGAPESLSLLGGGYTHLTSIPSTSNIYVTGNYPQQLQLDLTSSITGTTYASSNTKVLTVDTEGNVAALAFGTAVVTVQNKGVRAFETFVVENPSSPLAPQNMSAGIAVSLSGFQLNRSTGFYVQTVNLTNSLAIPLSGPLYFSAGSLPQAVTLVNPGTGLTQAIQPAGSPYIKLKLADGFTLQPGASVTLTLQFLNPSQVRINYTPQVFRAAGKP
jgi:hypothetical protein